MKKLSITFLIFAIPFLTFAQEKTKQKEIGLLFSNLDEFGLTYKIGSNKSMWRFSTILLSGDNNERKLDSTTTNLNNLGFNLGIGYEFKSEITDKLEFRYGPMVSYQFSKSKNDYDDYSVDNDDQITESLRNSYGIKFIIGLNYKINDNIIFGAEILPGVSYYINENSTEYPNDNLALDREIKTNGFNYGFSNSFAKLTLAYRF